MSDKSKLRCTCGKWVARKDADGNVFVWCKNCKKEVQVAEVNPIPVDITRGDKD